MRLVPWSSPEDFAARAVAFDTETHLADGECTCKRCAPDGPDGRRLYEPIPRLVCGSVADVDGGRLLDRAATCRTFVRLIRDPRIFLVFANGAFDLLVMARACREELGIDVLPDIFAAFEAERIFDVQIAEMLNAIADGMLGFDPFTGAGMRGPDGKFAWYSLWVCVLHVLGRDDAKENDEWRLRYGELDSVPLDQWSPAAAQYPVDDVRNTLDVALGQVGARPKRVRHEWAVYDNGDRLCSACLRVPNDAHLPCSAQRPHRNLHDLAAQTETAFALALGRAWGIPVDKARTAALRATVDKIRAEGVDVFIECGLLRRDKRTGELTENQAAKKRMICEAFGATEPCPACAGTGKGRSEKTGNPINCTTCYGCGFDTSRMTLTKTGRVAGDRDVLNESGNDILATYAHRQEKTAKLDNTYLPLLEAGPRVYPRAKKPIVDNGRCSYAKGMHGLPRKGGIRECFVADPGYVLNSSDWEGAELVTHGQNCIWVVGYSDLADALVTGKKPHNLLGAKMIGTSYEDFNARHEAKDKYAVDCRQAGKKANFGFPGGLGVPMFTIRILRSDKDLSTECEHGPFTLENGKRGYIGLRTCVLLGGRPKCGEVMTREFAGGTPICLACIEANKGLRDNWFKTWSENRKYFGKINQYAEEGMPLPDLVASIGPLQAAEFAQHRSWRIRGGIGFPDGANTLFSGLLADAAKAAYRAIARECYVKRRVETRDPPAGVKVSAYEGMISPLYGSKPLILAHDETISMHPRDVMHDAATRQGELMEEWLGRYCPDLAGPAIRCEPALMVRLSKEAKTVRDENGRLRCWDE